MITPTTTPFDISSYDNPRLFASRSMLQAPISAVAPGKGLAEFPLKLTAWRLR